MKLQQKKKKIHFIKKEQAEKSHCSVSPKSTINQPEQHWQEGRHMHTERLLGLGRWPCD